MKFTNEVWAEKRKNGIARFIFLEGILKAGGVFAVAMQFIGYFMLADKSATFSTYFGSAVTWTTFFLHATLFGSIMGYINWRRNEKMYAAAKNQAADEEGEKSA
ncbi:MAG TPA: hypothetical protein DEA22_07545 [Blastocatellia bacterium]|nr:hypothetical protein [Blastocatellia bacterium]